VPNNKSLDEPQANTEDVTRVSTHVSTVQPIDIPNSRQQKRWKVIHHLKVWHRKRANIILRPRIV